MQLELNNIGKWSNRSAASPHQSRVMCGNGQRGCAWIGGARTALVQTCHITSDHTIRRQKRKSPDDFSFGLYCLVAGTGFEPVTFGL